MNLNTGTSGEIFLHWINLLLGLIVFGEALALLVGAILARKKKNPWVSFKNISLILADIVCGGILTFLSIYKVNPQEMNLLYILGILILITHGYRSLEYRNQQLNKFCFNKPLFIVNNLKLFGSILVTGIGVLLRVNFYS